VLRNTFVLTVIVFLFSALAPVFSAEEQPLTREALTARLWPAERLRAALRSVEDQKAQGLLTEAAYARKKKMLENRLAGAYTPVALSIDTPPVNFIQNAGFEQTNPNSAKNRSRWLWWGGWSWGGDYENMWETRPEFVHSGKFSARITCTGAKGRIGINTASLPAVPGATEYKLTFWARGDGDNLLFVNFEEGATGELRQRLDAPWKQYTVAAKPVPAKNSYVLFFYSIGEGTIWLDDVELVPVGGTLDE
jgi:hypothetical protein